MTMLFLVPLFIGVLGLIAWIAATAVANTTDGNERYDPDRTFGVRGRVVLAFTLGFSMTGISVLYAGWASWLGVVLGIAGGVALAALARWIAAEDVT